MMPAMNGPLSEAYIRADTGNRLLTLSIVFMVAQILCVVLRFTSRYLSKTAKGMDDYLILPSLVFCLVLSVTGISVYSIFLHSHLFKGRV